MRANDLKKKYPEVWKSVEDAVRDDVRQCLIGNVGRIRKAPTDADIDRIAHNEAFVAVCAVRAATRPPTRKGRKGD